jgi:hypothetical protein
LHPGDKNVLCLFAGRASPLERWTTERDPDTHLKIAYKCPRRFKDWKTVETTLCHSIFYCSVFAVLSNLLGESERIDSKTFITVIKSPVKEFYTIFLNEPFFLRIRKDPLRSSICTLGWSPGWISLHFLLSCRERRAADVHALGKECRPPRGRSVCNAGKRARVEKCGPYGVNMVGDGRQGV